MLKLATARSRVILMVDATDHITGKTGLTLTITASKDGAAFASITPTVTELATGFYKLALTTAHTDTLGDFALHITGTGADPTDLVDQVVTDLPVVVPTAIENADALLNRDMATGTDSGSTTVRTVRNALRILRNKVTSAAGTMTVTKEDDTTSAWTAALTTDAGAVPIITIDPAGP